MALDIEALRLMPRELEVAFGKGYAKKGAVIDGIECIRDAQFAKLAWGLREQITDLRRTRHLHFDVMVVEKYIEEALEAAGIERPATG